MSHQHPANIWEIITAIASALMALMAVVAIVSYNVSKKTQYLSTIESCSKEYREYMRLIQKRNDLTTVKRDLLGLFHKQLFYIKNNYVPVNIKIEWLKTMHKVVSENGLMKDEDLSFEEKFEPKDWETSFHRVRDFMRKKEELEKRLQKELQMESNKERKNKLKEDGEARINKAVLRFYKRTYFSLWQRVCLIINSQWGKAFSTQKHGANK